MNRDTALGAALLLCGLLLALWDQRTPPAPNPGAAVVRPAAPR